MSVEICAEALLLKIGLSLSKAGQARAKMQILAGENTCQTTCTLI
jgi:hypothetical protein